MVFPAGGTIFIGRDAQFEARETLSNGSTRAATNVTWGSDAPSVASVSPAGLVRGLSPGEATIFADAGTRGSLRIRVFPNFGGSWSGTEVITSCEVTGAFAGLCAEFTPGATGVHASSFTQADASVNATIDGGDGLLAKMTGTISVGGELELPSAPLLPTDPAITVQVQNWRSRSDVPGVLTGTYDLLGTGSGVAGFLRIGLRLRDVVRTSAQAAQASSPGGSTIAARMRRWNKTSSRLF